MNRIDLYIKKDLLQYILMQRTQYLKKTIIHKAVAKLLRFFSFSDFGSIKANILLNHNGIKNEYNTDMWSEYISIKDQLPESAENILDIGCGIGGIDIYLYKHYKNSSNIYLIDKSAIDDNLHYGFKDQGSFYNSLLLTRSFLVENNVPEERIFVQEANAENIIEFNQQFDLIISLISWGFHYPVATYLKSAFDKLKTNGMIIIDVRKDSNGIEELKEEFKEVNIIKEFSKHFRVMVKKSYSA